MKNPLYSFLLGGLASLLVAAQPVMASADKEAAAEEADEAHVPKRITDRRHPDYVRCRLEPIIGSLAKKRRVCMTNSEWVAHINEGNRRANQFVSDMNGGLRTDVQ